MGSTHDLQSLLAARDARIRELEIENMELNSKLDKYQMIFSTTDGVGVTPPAAQPGGGRSAGAGQADSRSRRLNRGVGISAEPQSLKTLQDMTTKTFQEFKKDER